MELIRANEILASNELLANEIDNRIGPSANCNVSCINRENKIT